MATIGCKSGFSAKDNVASNSEGLSFEAAQSVSVVLTPTSGGSITDVNGNVWTFIGGTLPSLPNDKCDIVYGKNGATPYGGAAATHIVIYNGVLHQLSCIYGWYYDTGTGFTKASPAVATALNKIITKPKPKADVILTSNSGSFVDSAGATWKLDGYLFILRNNANVAGDSYPSGKWQTSTLVLNAENNSVYMWGSDSKWYIFDNSIQLFKLAASSPLSGANPAPFIPPVVPEPPQDIILTSSTGSFIDSKSATWKLDTNLFILRNNANVAGESYPSGKWQTNTLVYRQADKRVYIWGSDNQWYYYNDAISLFSVSSVKPLATDPAPFVPPSTPTPNPTPTPAPAPVPTPTPTPSAFTPPGRVVTVSNCNGSAANDTAAIINAQNSAGAGNTVQFANGQRCVISSMDLLAGVYYYVPTGQTATIVAAAVGNTLNFKNNVTFNGLSTCNVSIIASSTSGATIGNSNIGAASCGHDRIIANGASNFTIINNTISYTNEASLISYNPNALNVDGNYFHHCYQDCIGMPESANNSTIQRNIFEYTYKAVMEIGFTDPFGTTNFKVINNWSSLSMTTNNAINGWGYQLAYSIPLNGPGSSNNLVANNYANGSTPYGDGDICIEISGNATVRDNQCSNFNFGAIGYGTCSNSKIFTNNNLSETIYGTIVSYPGCAVGTSSMQISGTTTNRLAVPAKPARIAWGGRN